jgi:hypothetical protein
MAQKPASSEDEDPARGCLRVVAKICIHEIGYWLDLPVGLTDGFADHRLGGQVCLAMDLDG